MDAVAHEPLNLPTLWAGRRLQYQAWCPGAAHAASPERLHGGGGAGGEERGRRSWRASLGSCKFDSAQTNRGVCKKQKNKSIHLLKMMKTMKVLLRSHRSTPAAERDVLLTLDTNFSPVLASEI